MASLIAILRKAISWQASCIAEQIGITEIRSKRSGNAQTGWQAELIE
jgi:hypothetical protein